MINKTIDYAKGAIPAAIRGRYREHRNNRQQNKQLIRSPDRAKLRRAQRVYRQYREFTMVPALIYSCNLLLCEDQAPTTGCIVEAGVWRGGMSAGMADILPGRVHYLFDSFEGLPPVQEIDGPAAVAWQNDVNAPGYYDNCRAERAFAEKAMAQSNAKEVYIRQGWFNATVPGFVPVEPIAVLRLDGDWYESTMECLTGLYKHVMPGGLIILDDYYVWDGCARALHDFLSSNKLTERVREWSGEICYLIKSRE